MAAILLHFHPDTYLKLCSQTRAIVSTSYGDLSWENPSACLLLSLKALETGVAELTLAAVWKQEEGSLFSFYYFLENLKRQGLLCYQLNKGKPLATLVPAVLGNVRFQEMALEARLQWAKSATFSRLGTEWALTTPEACCKVILHDPLFLRVIWSLAESKTLEALQSEVKGIASKTLVNFLYLLSSASLLEKEDSSPEKRYALSDCIKYAHKLCYQQVGKT